MDPHHTYSVWILRGIAVLGQIRSIRRSASEPVLQSLIVTLVLSWLDYGSATLVSLPAVQLDRLQSVLNAAARLVLSGRKYDHATAPAAALVASAGTHHISAGDSYFPM